MSTIGSVEEAYEALCDGEFFQVGGKIINPDDIVRFEYNGGTDPVFYLEDGTTAQHNQYLDGDVGDLLVEAMSVATRGQSQSQRLIPPATIERIFTTNSNDEAQEHSTDGSVQGTTSIPYNAAFIPFRERFLMVNDYSTNTNILTYDIDESGNLSQNINWTPSVSGNQVSGMDATSTYILVTDGTPEASVYDINAGSEILSNAALNPDNENGGAALLGNGTGEFVSNATNTGRTEIYKYDVNGNSLSNVDLGSHGFQQAASLTADRKNEVIYAVTDSGKLYALDYSLAVKFTVSVGVSSSQAKPRVGPKGDYVAVGGDGEVSVVDVGQQTELFSNNPFSNTNGVRGHTPMATVDGEAGEVYAASGTQLAILDLSGASQTVKTFASGRQSISGLVDLPPTV